MQKENDSSQLLISYLTLRWVVGLLGVLLPILLVVGSFLLFSASGLEDSISDYYGTRMRNLFVGTLCAIACFLLTYKGHESNDNIAGNLACVLAVLVAFCPATSSSAFTRSVHFTAAALLFAVLAYFSIVLFTKTTKNVTPTPRKMVRNRIYVGCGVAILACIVLIGIYYLFLRETSVADAKPVFWLEAAALWAFGISWFVKGETLWRDQEGG